MKIVRKPSAQAANSSSLDHGHGPPLRTTQQSANHPYTEESDSDSFKIADFTHMSRHELHELISCQTRSGKMSLEGSATLAWLSVNLPGDTEQDTDTIDHEIVNFLNSAQLGRNTALTDNNSVAARQFEVALDLMHSIQGQTIGVDTLV